MKTAVEWLAEIKQGQKEQPFDDHEWQIAFEHAKEMEKEQVIDAFYSYPITVMSAEEYYNKTFKSE